MKSIVIFPDTNFLFECRDPVECPWSEISDAEQITLAICRTVRSEVDKHKADKGRLGRRARQWTERLRAISRGTNPSELRATAPRVLVWVTPPVAPIARLPAELDTARGDDRIIAEILAHKSADATLTDAIFLTDDGGASDTARYIGLETIDIPLDDETKPRWRLEREADHTEKRFRELEGRLQQLEADKPRIGIVALDENNEAANEQTFQILEFNPLAPTDVAQLLDQAMRLHPCTPVSTGTRQNRATDALMGALQRWVPPSQADILEYVETKYPRWQENVETFFTKLHSMLATPAHLMRGVFEVGNNGTTPAQNALVTVDALGDITVAYVPDLDEKHSSIDLSLPPPPMPPQGRYMSFNSFGPDRVLGPHDFGLLHRTPPRKGDVFYRRRTDSKTRLQWDCEEFRHQTEPKLFPFIVRVPRGDLNRRSVAVQCTVEASNLPEPQRQVLRLVLDPRTGDTGKLAVEILHGGGPGLVPLDGTGLSLLLG